jgi:hypothetical protein
MIEQTFGLFREGWSGLLRQLFTNYPDVTIQYFVDDCLPRFAEYREDHEALPFALDIVHFFVEFATPTDEQLMNSCLPWTFSSHPG